MSSPDRPPKQAEAEQRLHLLAAAQRTITDDLSIASMLERIVRAACDLVGARYGALGVLGRDGAFEQFVHHGMDDDALAALGDLPVGRGLLDVPIRVRGAVFGNLYLADPAAGTFTPDDEDVLTSLAATAGAAIDNARLYVQAQRTNEWLAASGEIARGLLADPDADLPAELARRAVELADADLGWVVVPDDHHALRIVVAVGDDRDRMADSVVAHELSALARMVAKAEPMLIAHARTMMRPRATTEFDAGLLVPLSARNGSRGALLLLRRDGRPGFTDEELNQVSTFAAQVALALELNDARVDAEQLHRLKVRHRIAQDLHDNVMQRLFAIGVGLQGIVGTDQDPERRARVRSYVDELDETIDQIRSQVFGLRGVANQPVSR